MISGEYAVLEGAKALAVPTKHYGQYLNICNNTKPQYHWRSYDPSGLWFEAVFSNGLDEIISSSNASQAKLLHTLLQYIHQQKPDLFATHWLVETQLQFPRAWGFGSSSSLIALLAKWSGISPFTLLEKSFGGSGYDVAVAMENKPVIYQLSGLKHPDKQAYNGKYPTWGTTNFSPDFAEELYLIYLNKKQNSRSEIKKFRQNIIDENIIDEISQLTENFTQTTDLKQFEICMYEHEKLVSQLIGRPSIKEQMFKDYPHAIKSLGAWGGDFILAAGTEAPEYFKAKSYETILNFKDILI